MDFAAMQSILYDHIMEARRQEAAALLGEAIAGAGYEATLLSLLEPTLAMLGERWSSNALSLAQGFVAGKVAEDFLAMGAPVPGSPDARETVSREPLAGPARIAVIANAEDDYHAMGRSLVSTFLRLRGWQVEDLGCDVLAGDLVDRAVSIGACVVGISAMMLTTARNVLKVRAEIDARGLAGKLFLAVGGAVFRMRPELVAELGGDGTAETALDAPALFESFRLRSAGTGAASQAESAAP